MAMMYLARFTRPDILFVVSYLATKGMTPTVRDYGAACRALRYLECSGDWAILFRRNSKFRIRITCDASHGLYKDGKGQGGITVSVGSGIVHARSSKIKMTTHSTCESEGVTTSEADTYAVFMVALCRALGQKVTEAVEIKQDNDSNIWMQTHDGKFNRNKHVWARRNYVKELILDKLVNISHADSDYLESDMLTKVVDWNRLIRHMKRCGMVCIGNRLNKEEVTSVRKSIDKDMEKELRKSETAEIKVDRMKKKRDKKLEKIRKEDEEHMKRMKNHSSESIDCKEIKKKEVLKKSMEGVLSNEKRIKKRVVIRDDDD